MTATRTPTPTLVRNIEVEEQMIEGFKRMLVVADEYELGDEAEHLTESIAEYQRDVDDMRAELAERSVRSAS
jgi:hypothetical protein